MCPDGGFQFSPVLPHGFLPRLLRRPEGDRIKRPRPRRKGPLHAPAAHELRRQALVRAKAVTKFEQGVGMVLPTGDALEDEFLAVPDGGLRQPIRPRFVWAGGIQLDVLPIAECQELLAPKLWSSVRPEGKPKSSHQPANARVTAPAVVEERHCTNGYLEYRSTMMM